MYCCNDIIIIKQFLFTSKAYRIWDGLHWRCIHAFIHPIIGYLKRSDIVLNNCTILSFIYSITIHHVVWIDYHTISAQKKLIWRHPISKATNENRFVKSNITSIYNWSEKPWCYTVSKNIFKNTAIELIHK